MSEKPAMTMREIREALGHNINPSHESETARELLYRHGLPEDVIDGALCLHAQELVEQIREDAALREAEGETDLAQYGRELAELIDPTRTPAA